MKEKYYNFTLILTRPDFNDEEVVDKLFDANCDDGTFCFSIGRYELIFDRKASSLHQAIISAINDLEKSGIGSYVKQIILGEDNECDECDGGGHYFIDGKRQTCICSESQSTGEEEEENEVDLYKSNISYDSVLNQKFIEAIERGNLDDVINAYLLGADIHFDNEWALKNASECGDLDIVKFLVSNKANMYVFDNAIELARKNEYMEVVEYLKSKRAEQLNNTKTPDLTKSCRERNDHFQNCNTCPDGFCCDNTNLLANPLYRTQKEMDDLEKKTYKFVEAVQNGDLQAAADAYIAGANIHWKDEWALRWAAATGNMEMVILLAGDDGTLLTGDNADIHALNDRAIRLARQHGHTEVVEYLKSRGAGEMDNVKIPDLTKSCRERNDHFQNCNICPDGSCGDNTNPVATIFYYTQEEIDELDSATYKLIEAVECGDYADASNAVRLLEADIHWKNE